MEPSGFLPFKTEPGAGDKLILYPVYLCPVEIFERGLFVRPSYYRRLALVNAFSGFARLLEFEDTPLRGDFDASAFETIRLEVRISPERAAELAGQASVPDRFKSWRGAVRNRRAAVVADKIRLVWYAYAVRGGDAADLFTGETVPAASLINIFFA